MPSVPKWSTRLEEVKRVQQKDGAPRFTLERMNQFSVAIYYVSCQEESCWVLFNPKPPLPLSLTCRLHGHQLEPAELTQGYVTEFEANQGWTKQRPS